MTSPRPSAPLLAALLSFAALLAPAQAATAASQATTERTLATLVRGLSGNAGASVRETGTKNVLASRNASTKRVPASVTKLFTTSSVLLADGPDARLRTELRMRGELGDGGVLDGDLIVRGGGDPTLRLDQLVSLADAARRAGIRRVTGTLRADLAGWTSQQGTAKTAGGYDREIGGRLGALVTLRGYSSGSTDPSRQVLVRLRALLSARGISGLKLGAAGPSGPGTTVIKAVQSPTLAQLAAATNGPSDNFYAEMLLRGLGARHGAGGTTGGGLAAEREILKKELNVSAQLADGSGLSRGNKVSAGMVVRLLDGMAARDEGRALRASLPLAGSTGTLAGRMRGTKAAGRCRAKTGTLRDVSALAGWCTTIGGRSVSFAILQNRVSPATARSQQNRIAAAIAAWSDRPVQVTPPARGDDDDGRDAADSTTPRPSGATTGGATAG